MSTVGLSGLRSAISLLEGHRPSALILRIDSGVDCLGSYLSQWQIVACVILGS